MPHSHLGGTCEHESHEDPELGIQYTLFNKIDIDNTECLNESVEGAGRLVFKAWENRLDHDKFVESDVDPELLFNIPFTGAVKLKGIIVMGDDMEKIPTKVKLFKNRPGMTFDDAQCKADQEIELNPDMTGFLEYPIKVVHFSSVTHLSLYFTNSTGGDVTKILYIGLKGEFFEAHHHGVTICNYESTPQMSDHKNPLSDVVGRSVM